MLTPKKSVIFLLFIFISAMSSGQTSTAHEYMGVKGPLTFSKKTFFLSWTAHPSLAYYKQEYLERGVNADKYKTMVMLEALTGTSTPKDLLDAKVQELKIMKQTNPMVSYEMVANAKTGEYMLDFMLTANKADGSIAILERNVYRYMKLPDAVGTGVLLFAVSQRAYDKEVTKFLAGLKTTRKLLMTEVANFTIPAITLEK
jgi:hypothetical protein